MLPCLMPSMARFSPLAVLPATSRLLPQPTLTFSPLTSPVLSPRPPSLETTVLASTLVSSLPLLSSLTETSSSLAVNPTRTPSPAPTLCSSPRCYFPPPTHSLSNKPTLFPARITVCLCCCQMLLSSTVAVVFAVAARPTTLTLRSSPLSISSMATATLLP